MSKIDDFLEMLKSYEDPVEESFRNSLTANACKTYDSLEFTLRQYILECFSLANKFGFMFDDSFQRMEKDPEYFNKLLMSIEKSSPEAYIGISSHLFHTIVAYGVEEKLKDEP